MNPILVGFDKRITDPQVIAENWKTPRRETFLIDPNIETPLSVDTMVLPSGFQFGEGFEWDSFTPISVAIQDAHSAILDHWNSIESMQSAFEKGTGLEGLKTIDLAISIDLETKSWKALMGTNHSRLKSGEAAPENTDLIQNIKNNWQEIMNHPAKPESLNDEWTFAGYDVADGFLLSGLSNCGLPREGIGDFRKAWRSKINPYGLFAEARDAQEFSNFCNMAIPEHAPFFPYGLYVK